VTNQEVVMLGDSYMDIGNVGPTIQMVANNAMYRTYYLAGAALNYGTGQGNIPYQFDSMAVPANPDIKVVITDGGGNDILINNRQCLTTPVQGDTMCHMVVDSSVMAGSMMEQDMASKGVKQIVYFFYPHVDPTAALTGANANDWVDYAYPKAAAACCGASNVPASGDLTCEGTGPGVECVFIDTRPEFEGHNDPTNSSAYWFQDGVHPTQPGADAIANKVWAQMQKYCIAQ
jgi:phospholipase/lecithinase/hemolysin